jgi:hypothetical protein
MANYHVFQIKETTTWVVVRKLEMGTALAECAMISHWGNLVQGTTAMVPLESLDVNSRCYLTMATRRTMKAYYTQGKPFAFDQSLFQLSYVD